MHVRTILTSAVPFFFFRGQGRAAVPFHYLSRNPHTHQPAPAARRISARVQVVLRQGGGEKAAAIAVDRAAPAELQSQWVKLREERSVRSSLIFFCCNSCVNSFYLF